LAGSENGLAARACRSDPKCAIAYTSLRGRAKHFGVSDRYWRCNSKQQVRTPSMAFQNRTEMMTAQYPLAHNPRLEVVAAWVATVAPCLVPGATQSRDDTETIIDHLRRKRVSDEAIATVLVWSHYNWTVQDMRISHQMIIVESRRKGPQQPTGTGARGKIDMGVVKRRAKELDGLYNANRHNPEYQEKLRNELIGLLKQLDDPSGGDPMPGRGQMETQREKLRTIQEEILQTAGQLGRDVSLQLGPLGVHRARGGFAPTPDRPGTPYRPPPLRNPPRR